jgi:hypothetical protein
VLICILGKRQQELPWTLIASLVEAKSIAKK